MTSQIMKPERLPQAMNNGDLGNCIRVAIVKILLQIVNEASEHLV